MDTITVFFATNRNLLPNGERMVDDNAPTAESPRFGIHPADFRVGAADVVIHSHDPVCGAKVDDEAKFLRAELANETYEHGEFTTKGSDQVFPALMNALNTLTSDTNGSTVTVRRSALVFIPGFNYSFRESIERGALLAHLYGTPRHQLVPFVFSWPSDGSIWFSYDDDRRDARASGEAGGRAYRTFIRYLFRQRREQQCISAAFLVAHSMGAYVLRYAVQEAIRKPEEVFPIFEAAIIPAADEERDALAREEKLLPLSRLASQVIVYANKSDKPLRFADNPPRLGHHGPSQGAEEVFDVPITTVTCDEVDRSEEDGTRHQYYRISPEVVKDIVAVFEGVPPGQFPNRVRVREGGYRLVRDAD